MRLLLRVAGLAAFVSCVDYNYKTSIDVIYKDRARQRLGKGGREGGREREIGWLAGRKTDKQTLQRAEFHTMNFTFRAHPIIASITTHSFNAHLHS